MTEPSKPAASTPITFDFMGRPYEVLARRRGGFDPVLATPADIEAALSADPGLREQVLSKVLGLKIGDTCGMHATEWAAMRAKLSEHIQANEALMAANKSLAEARRFAEGESYENKRLAEVIQRELDAAARVSTEQRERARGAEAEIRRHRRNASKILNSYHGADLDEPLTLEAIEVELGGENGLVASKDAGWAIAKSRLEQLEAERKGRALADRMAETIRWALDKRVLIPGDIAAACEAYDRRDQQPSQAPAEGATVGEKCGNCARCLGTVLSAQRMIVCITCGNRRCPKATYHGHLCSGSNEAEVAEDFPPFGVNPADSAALLKLRSAVDDADMWPSTVAKGAGDYEAAVEFMAGVVRQRAATDHAYRRRLHNQRTELNRMEQALREAKGAKVTEGDEGESVIEQLIRVSNERHELRVQLRNLTAEREAFDQWLSDAHDKHGDSIYVHAIQSKLRDLRSAQPAPAREPKDSASPEGSTRKDEQCNAYPEVSTGKSVRESGGADARLNSGEAGATSATVEAKPSDQGSVSATLGKDHGYIGPDGAKWTVRGGSLEDFKRAAAAQKPDPLHPDGRCDCGGEGRCEWCRTHCLGCGKVIVSGVRCLSCARNAAADQPAQKPAGQEATKAKGGCAHPGCRTITARLFCAEHMQPADPAPPNPHSGSPLSSAYTPEEWAHVTSTERDGSPPSTPRDLRADLIAALRVLTESCRYAPSTSVSKFAEMLADELVKEEGGVR